MGLEHGRSQSHAKYVLSRHGFGTKSFETWIHLAMEQKHIEQFTAGEYEST